MLGVLGFSVCVFGVALTSLFRISLEARNNGEVWLDYFFLSLLVVDFSPRCL